MNEPPHEASFLPFGHTIERYESVASTNDLIKQRARAGIPEGLAILADEQRAGRGRQGRGWHAPPGSSLLVSLLLRPTWLPVAQVFRLTMMAGVALCEAVELVAPVQAALKWPNDLLLPVPQPVGPPALRKAAGILSEAEITKNQIAWLVLGIGVNVSWSPAGTVDGRDLAASATSVSAAANVPVDREALLHALLARLDQRYGALRRGDEAALFAAWQARLAMLGRVVTVRLPAGELRGVAEAVEPTGALRLRDERGALHSITAGDVEA